MASLAVGASVERARALFKQAWEAEVMSRVGIADLKAHLSHHLRKVRGGLTITILDRDTPVAQIVPYDVERPLEVRRASRKPRDLRLPRRLASRTDSLSTLLRDRSSR